MDFRWFELGEINRAPRTILSAETIWNGFTKIIIAAETTRLLRDDGDADISV